MLIIMYSLMPIIILKNRNSHGNPHLWFLPPRLDRFVKNASSFLTYFEPYLGRIEILGKAGRIERVYFEITEANVEQWEKPQIKVR